MIRFQDLCVADVMTREPVCLSEETTLFEAEELLLGRELEAAPVLDRDGLFQGSCGIRTLLQARRAASPDEQSVGGLELELGRTCEPSLRLAQACQQMIREHAHRLVVLEEGRPIGIVSSIEAARVLACLEDLSQRQTSDRLRAALDPSSPEEARS